MMGEQAMRKSTFLFALMLLVIPCVARAETKAGG
jgi:hypothetical protein